MRRPSDIQAWFNKPISPSMSEGDLFEAYHRQHPSRIFLRNLPLDSKVADIGAGDGGLSVFKKWPSPARSDLKLYAFSLEKGERFDDFDGYELGDWNVSRPSFDGIRFNAVHCSNFIEHIDDPGSLIEWADGKLDENGRLYLEWPAPNSLYCPTLPDLAAMGFGCIIGNYHDDPTHRKRLPTFGYVVKRLRRSGFEIEASGVVSMPLLADELLANYRASSNLISLQLAYWLRTGWIQYVVAARRGEALSASEFVRRAKMAVKRPPDHAAFADRMRAGKDGAR